MPYFIHPSALIADNVHVGEEVKIWHLVQVRESVHIGDNTIVGKNVYIDFEVMVGKNCKIQNNSSLYHGAVLEDGVFVGPHVVLTNDKIPRAITPEGALKEADDWQVEGVTIKYGASIGAHSVLLPGVTIGRFAMVGAGSVVTKDVPDFGLVVGNPARLIARVNEAGKIVEKIGL